MFLAIMFFISKDLIEVAFRLGDKNFLKYVVLCVTIISQFMYKLFM